MRKTILNRFKCMRNIVRTIVVRVLRSFEHNPDYDLGNPRAASAGADGQNPVRHYQTLPDTFEQYPHIIRHYRTSSNMIEHCPTLCGDDRLILQF